MTTASLGAGDLNRRLVLEAPVETGDGAGGVAVTYETVATLWARIKTHDGRAAVIADAAGAAVPHTIVIRAGIALTARHRFRDGTRIYRIVAIRDSADRRFREIDAEARED